MCILAALIGVVIASLDNNIFVQIGLVVLMTSFAFILGVVPLVLAKGAGFEMRSTLGIAVFSGMLGVTVFGIFFTPVFYYVIRWFSGRSKSEQHRTEPAQQTSAASAGKAGDGKVIEPAPALMGQP